MFDRIYIDMDGVLADYYKLVNTIPKTIKFRQKVLEEEIFLKLEMMPGAQHLISELIEYQYDWPQCGLEILSSGGSYHRDIFDAATKQKDIWLAEHGFHWPRNYTHCGESKAMFARKGTLLIDDTPTNCINFEWNEGKSLLWDGNNPNDSIERLRMVLGRVTA